MKYKNPVSKKVLAVVLALGVIASIGYFGANGVLADSENPVHRTLITRIAEKFNLKEEDVAAVFEAVRDEKQDEMDKAREDRLTQAVTDGVITGDQKQAIITKMQEDRGERGENREEMRTWFKEQGIDELKLREYLRPFGGRKGFQGELPR